MDGVLCYSGYILPVDGDASKALVFSIMTNNTTATPAEVRSQIMKLVSALVQN